MKKRFINSVTWGFVFNLEDFDFNLPDELIAQKPVEPRDHSRLMVVEDKIEHRMFYDLPQYLKKGDVIVFNDTKVIRAKFHARKETGGRVILILLDPKEKTFLFMGKNPRVGLKIYVKDVEGEITEKNEGICKIDFKMDMDEMIKKYGETPLPPYIKKKIENDDLYQTVYSKNEGSIAAPTAGLHFTEKLLNEIDEMNVKRVYLTLHISYSTFRPIKKEDVLREKLHEEFFSIPEETAKIVNGTEGRVIAVGTTVVRAMETSSIDGILYSGFGKTDIFIKPSYIFKSKINAMITNFHIPKSSLIMLVTAFGGYERVMNAYSIAIKEKYRFYSFGDAMLLFKQNLYQNI